VYHRWPELLPEGVEVVAINLPGRGARAHEAPVTSIEAAADSITAEIVPLLDVPSAFFGHCMGGILMYEVVRRLEAKHGKVAGHVFVSGCMAPHLYNSPLVHEQGDAPFLDILRLISFSGTQALLDDPALRNTLFPTLRADFRAVVEYGDSLRAAAPLTAPVTGLAADRDLFAAPRAMRAWGQYTKAGYELAQLEGDHYFVESHREAVTQIVAARLAKLVGRKDSEPREDVPNVRWLRPDGDGLGRPPRPVGRRTPRPVLGDGLARVICFPGAGIPARELRVPASSASFTYAAMDMRGPGRPPRTVREMVDRALAAYEDSPRPTLFYGHCIGSIVAYELSRRLEREGRATPVHLVVAGTVGPHLYIAPDAYAVPEPKLLELLHVLKYPYAARLRDDSAFRRERLPLVRADLEAMSEYQYLEGDPVSVPITAIALRHDLWSYPLRTSTWGQHTSCGVQLLEWPGDHYVPMAAPERVGEVIEALAQRSAAAE
jgi:surfactin synthase thioesterase subunit